ncbi:MAG: AhpC/TSA family protein [Bacteroidaceae bacterium]|nr:AhpC/TSA family protein [Bacteroidaceae bacterium]
MKNTLTALLCSLLLLACSHSNTHCTIEGHYDAPNGTVLYLTPIDNILAPTDSATIKNGRFAFAINDTTPAVRFLASNQVIDGNYVFIEKGTVKVNFTGPKFASGTPGNDKLSRFITERQRYVDIRRMATPEFVKAMSFSPQVYDSIKQLETVASRVFRNYAIGEIMTNLNNPLGYFFLINSVGLLPAQVLESLFPRVPAPLRDNLYNKMITRIENELHSIEYIKKAQENQQATAVGKQFQDFELNNIKGGKVLFSNEVTGNQYTLLLFWGSWNANWANLAALEGAYTRYKENGLQIVGVSLDSSVEECRATTDELGLSWVQLCNPGGGSAELAAAYGVTLLPSAVLVNKRGVIIARLDTMEDILAKIKELF